jgi:glucose-6-phosphate dehydrogenase assembly protein OpcA
LLADFYDVPSYQPLLDGIDYVRIDYVAPATEPEAVAPQALLMAGWLANRLQWTLNELPSGPDTGTLAIEFFRNGRNTSLRIAGGISRHEIKLELNRVERGEQKPGRLVEVELRTGGRQPASFSVKRSADGLHVLAEASLGSDIQRGRVLPVRNRSLAQLLVREMEIMTNDNLYQQALETATGIIAALR